MRIRTDWDINQDIKWASLSETRSVQSNFSSFTISIYAKENEISASTVSAGNSMSCHVASRTFKMSYLRKRSVNLCRIEIDEISTTTSPNEQSTVQDSNISS